MSVKRGKDNGRLEQSQAADQLLRTFLKDFTPSEADLNLRETILLDLPKVLKQTGQGKVDNVVLFPFGTFYHGIGFKDDPLTIYVTTGHPIKDVPIPQQGKDTNITGNICTTNSDSLPEGEKNSSSCSWDQGRMRQSLLLDINDILINSEGMLQETYKNVTLTRQGKLYFVYHPLGYGYVLLPSKCDLKEPQNIPCLLEAKSFLPVQWSRLLKFYCILEELFWSFSILVLNWARNHGILESSDKTDSDGVKQEHLLSLVIFFLVRRRIIPSFKLLQEWSTSPLVVNEINVGFCEDIELVRKNCKNMGIGSGKEEWTLERILQLLYEFFNELATFNFVSWVLQTATGRSVSKSPRSRPASHEINPSGKRRLDSNSLLCIQDVLDERQNITRKVCENSVLKLRSRCRDAAARLFPLLWRGDILSAVLDVLDFEVQREDVYEDINMIDWEEGHRHAEMSMGSQRRCIKFKIPQNIIQLFAQCWDLAKKDDCYPFMMGRVDGAYFGLAVKAIFQKFVEEFNGIFWTKLVAAHVIQSIDGAAGPIYFDVMNYLQCPAQLSKEEKAAFVVESVLRLYVATAFSEIGRFYVKNDWTRKCRDDILLQEVTKSDVDRLVKSLLKDMGRPEVVYGPRVGPPRTPQIEAEVELDLRWEEGGLYVYTLVRNSESSHFELYLDWYNEVIESFVVKKFIKWIGANMTDLIEKLSVPVTEMKLAKNKASRTAQGSTSMSAITSMTSGNVNSRTNSRQITTKADNVGGFFPKKSNWNTNKSVKSRVVKVSSVGRPSNPYSATNQQTTRYPSSSSRGVPGVRGRRVGPLQRARNRRGRI